MTGLFSGVPIYQLLVEERELVLDLADLGDGTQDGSIRSATSEGAGQILIKIKPGLPRKPTHFLVWFLPRCDGS